VAARATRTRRVLLETHIVRRSSCGCPSHTV
jgi:hypothetical protein